MDRLIKLTHRLTRYGAWFGGALIFASAFVVGFEVFIRKVFDLSMGGANDLSSFALAIGTAWALAFALLERAHIRIDSVYMWMPLSARAIMDVIGLVAFFIFFGLMTIRGWSTFFETVALNAHSVSPLGTPLVYPQFLWVMGLTFLMVVTSLLLVHVVLRLIRRDFVAVQGVAGSKSADEELEEELTIGRTLRGPGEQDHMPLESGR